MLPVDTWISLEDVMLSEIRQSQKDKHCTIPLMRDTQSTRQIHRDRKQNRGFQGLKEGNEDFLFNEYKVSVWQAEKSSRDEWW